MVDHRSNRVSAAEDKFRRHKKRIARFQASEPNGGLCSLKATVARVNLTAANVIVLCDPWWSPAVEAQAGDHARGNATTKC